MNTIPTNDDGLTQTDEIAIQKSVRKNLRAGFSMSPESKKRLLEKHELEYDKAVAMGWGKLADEVMKTLLTFEQTDLKRLEIFDKIDRLDRGDVTDRTQTFTIIINEDQAPYLPAPADDNDPPKPVPQAD
jgi:hypothetical protein